MSETAVTTRGPSEVGQLATKTIEELVIRGDIKGLTPQAKVEYYLTLCKSLDLNPATQPFQVIAFQGREQLYPKKDATDQLRDRRGISVTKLETKEVAGIFLVTAYGIDKNGRTDASTGAVNVKGLSGESLANAYMKAETKAKRRLTLSLSGLGMLDESETDSVSGRREFKSIDLSTGETTVVEVHEPAPAPAAKERSPRQQRFDRLLADGLVADPKAVMAKIKAANGDGDSVDAILDAEEKAGRDRKVLDATAGKAWKPKAESVASLAGKPARTFDAETGEAIAVQADPEQAELY